METSQSKELVLVIEDSDDIARPLTDTILRPSGYEPLLADSGQEGLRQALEKRPALILLDLNLAEMTGMEVVRGLRETVPSIPITLMVYSGSEELAVEAFRLGVKNYVMKPLKAQEVLKAIDDGLRETRLRREKELLTEELMRANSQVERRVRELNTLHGITQAITSALDLETLLSRVVEAAVFLTDADEGMIFLIDEETDELYLRAAKGLADKRASLLLMPARDSLIGQVVRSGEPLRIGTSDARLDLTVKTGYMVNALLYIPLRFMGRTKGVLAVSNRVSERAFSRTDQSRLELLADHTVMGMEVARLHEESERREPGAVGGSVAELAGYASSSLKTFAADMYALKMSADRGLIGGSDEAWRDLLDSMERGIEQMAAVTELLEGLASPETPEVEREQMERRLRKLQARHAT
jgi:two-component system NtrC family sensor kinase